MSAADVPLRYRRLRAPREDGAALVDPPIAEAAKLVAANQALAETWDRASGLYFARWRSEARGNLLLAAAAGDHRRWTHNEYALRHVRPFVLAGHQPSLFHPGVWFKSFLLDRIAKEVEGTAVNLLVDNDTYRQAGIRVPTVSNQSLHLIDVPLDAPAPEMPWEERGILDPVAFQGFAGRVRTAFHVTQTSASRRSLLIDSVWHHATAQAVWPADPALYISWEKSLGRRLAYARHAIERSIGLDTVETPISRICSLGCMRDFLDHLLSRWGELHPIYNAALREYRTVNHIRSRKHPAPDLAIDGEWLEIPLWIWDRFNPQRRRPFVRCMNGGWELTDRVKIRLSSKGGPAGTGGAPWMEAEFKHGIKLRPRALITTMFARLILSDLFIHGIGGAKYDELTDALIRRFFGIEPPAFMTATATFRLPIERPNVTADDVRRIERRIRDIAHHPESFVSELAGSRGSEISNLAMQKQELIAAGWQEKQKKAWHESVTACNERMAALLSGAREQLRAERERLLAKLHAAELLGSREFSFVLFPEETLPRELLDLCAATA